MECRIDHSSLPQAGLALINRLNRAGYEAWFVGGCVRDLLMGIQPHDWDICTSALPEELESVLADFRIHETGIRHGTVMVMSGGEGFEITTFRTEGAYTDHRRPDSVRFVRDLASDLARRDFTINAMAYHSKFGLVDLYDGREDLKNGLIRAVGEPEERFSEDALRILRALRFAGRFDFQIESATAEAIHRCREDLHRIAAERVFAELKELLVSPGCARLMLEFRDVFAVILPEVEPLFDFDQNNPHHDSDGWHHTARTVAAVRPDVVLRLSALLHDTGKPDCKTRDEAGISHFYGHNRRSKELAHAALLRLRCDNDTRLQVETLVGMHDSPMPQTMAQTRRFLGKYGLELTRKLLELRRADVLSQSQFHRAEKLKQQSDFRALVDRAEAEGDCWSVQRLAVKGGDLIALGTPAGPEVGRRLEFLLKAVLDGEVPNEREALLNWLSTHQE